MGWFNRNRSNRVVISLLVTALVLGLVLLPAGPGLALNVSMAEVPSGKTTYNLGETVTFSGAVTLAEGELRDIQSVTLYITGPQPLTLQLPMAEGTYNLTGQLPTDGQGQPLGALSTVITWSQVTYAGYGYGYQGGTGGGQIDYTISYTPPVFKYPAPPPPLPEIWNPQSAFAVPGGGGGAETLNAQLQFYIPGVPGAPQGSTPKGLAFEPSTNTLYILVNGTSNDILLSVDPYGGYLFSFVDTGVPDARGVTVWNGDVYVVGGAPSQPKLTRVIDNSPTQDGPAEVLLPAAGGLKVQGVTKSSSGTVFVAYLEPDPAKGIPIKEVDLGGNIVQQVMVPGSPSGGGFKALARESGGFDLVGGFGTTLVMFDPGNGFIFKTKSVDVLSGGGDITEIEGLAFVGGTQDLYIADGPTAAIYMAAPGSGPGGAQPFPRGLASDGTDLFILVDGNPDKVMKVNTSGQKLDEFATPAGNIESLTYKSGNLYMIENSYPPKLWRINPGNPTDKQSWNLPNWLGEIAGMSLSADGTQLIAMERWTDTFHYIDPANGTVTNSVGLYTTGPAWPPGGLDALAIIDNYAGPSGAKLLLGGKWNNFFRFSPQTGQVTMVDMVAMGMPPYDITGLTVLGSVVYIADSGTQQIFRGKIPGAPPAEPTTIGNYTAELKAVYTGSQVTVSSTAVSYTVQKVSPVTIAITSPAEGDAFTTPSITVTGTVNDPTIAQVTVGVALPTTTLFQSDVEEGQTQLNQNWSAAGMWHASGNGKKIDTTSWYYGQEPQMNYDTGQSPNAGDLNTKSITIGQGTSLTFYTWYDTEPGFDWDRKLIQWVTSGGTQTVAQIMDFFPPPPPGQPFMPPQPGTVYQPQQFGGFMPFNWPMVWVPMARYEGGQPTFTQVTLDLSGFAGQTGQIRFRFDTIDAWGNNFEGWYVDDVSVQGAGFEGSTVNVASNLTWQAQFTLAEGQNTISAQATRNAYNPVETVTTQVNVYKDASNPVVVIDPVTSPTNNSIQTVTGSFTELAPDTLEMYVNSKLVLTEKTFSGSTFSKSISLSEGTNSILVKLTDKGGLTGQATASIELDTTGPTITVLSTAYPTGEVSARANDFFVFQVKAEDAATGIQKVEMQMPGGPGQQGTQLVQFKPVSQIPVAVRNQWGVSSQATHLFPMSLPSSAPPGAYALTAIATDSGGNTTTATVSATVVSTLSKFNIYLMPDWNLVSLPLIPDDGSVATTLGSLPSGSLNSAWYYDAAASAWKSYVPGAPSNDLTTLGTGKGYWVRMNSSAFTQSAPLAPGLPQTPVPIKLTIPGVALIPGTVPPTYTVSTGWNLVGLHAEHSKQVSIALKSLTSQYGADLWGSILEYQNFIYFPTSPGAEPQVVLGAFRSNGSSDNMEPGKGYWLYMNQAGTIVP